MVSKILKSDYNVSVSWSSLWSKSRKSGVKELQLEKQKNTLWSYSLELLIIPWTTCYTIFSYSDIYVALVSSYFILKKCTDSFKTTSQSSQIMCTWPIELPSEIKTHFFNCTMLNDRKKKLFSFNDLTCQDENKDGWVFWEKLYLFFKNILYETCVWYVLKPMYWYAFRK